MLEVLDRLYNIKGNEQKYKYRLTEEHLMAPIILGSATNWHLQEMVGAQIYVCLLLYYHLKGELKRIGAAMKAAAAPINPTGAPTPSEDEEDFAAVLEQLLETLFERLMNN